MAQPVPPPPTVPTHHVLRPWWVIALVTSGCLVVLPVAAQVVADEPGAVLSGIATLGAFGLIATLLRLYRHGHELADRLNGAAVHADTERRQLLAATAREEELRAGQAAAEQAWYRRVGFLRERALPAVRDGQVVPRPPRDPALDPAADELLGALLQDVSGVTAAEREARESMRLVVIALARRVQAGAHRTQEAATVLGERHSAEPDVVEATMAIDHAAAQQARLAQSLAVLCGEWPGQQWREPMALVDVARAAAGRIVAYQRVEVTGDQDIAAAPPAVEPLIHVVAEFLGNATQSSPPSATVPVRVRTVQRGAVLEIDDLGVGMDEHRLERAGQIASGRRGIELGDIGEVPQTGLPVAGRLARRHGFRVDLSESPYGGVRVVILVPLELVETLEPATSVPATSASTFGAAVDTAPPAVTVPAPAPAADTRVADSPVPGMTGPAGMGTADSVGTTDAADSVDAAGAADVADPGPADAAPATDGAQRPSGLPQRTSLRDATEPGTAAHAATAPAAEGEASAARAAPAASPREAGEWMGAFFSGARQAPADTGNDGETD